jgi:hypothetical protein
LRAKQKLIYEYWSLRGPLHLADDVDVFLFRFAAFSATNSERQKKNEPQDIPFLFFYSDSEFFCELILFFISPFS